MQKQVNKILNNAVETLKETPGVVSIVLGGSRARGTHLVDSDIDIGIYYDADKIDLEILSIKAKMLDDEKREQLISPIGAWGKWVNAGGWLKTDGFSVDLILRDIKRVDQVIAESSQGKIVIDYQPGHPHAFINYMYMGEVAICEILSDPLNILKKLKEKTSIYPAELRKALIDFFSFEVRFSQNLAETNANKDDKYYVTAHIIRSISSLNQMLFAINNEYFLNEKKAVKTIETFKYYPKNYKNKIDEILLLTGSDSTKASYKLNALIEETDDLLSKS